MNLDWPTPDDQITGVYAKYAPIYDVLFEHSLSDAEYYLHAAERLRPGDEILELGVGTGRLTERYLERGFRVVGVDSSRDMLEQARRRLARHAGRFELVHADMREFDLGRRFASVVAPFGTVAHLLTDADRSRAFHNAYLHLADGGEFIFDDLPGWIAGRSDGTSLDLRCEQRDPETGRRVRLQTNLIDAADAPVSVRYDFIDWLEPDGGVARRVVVRVVFRNIALDDELALLAGAGFSRFDLYGDFAGTPLDRARPSENRRLVVHGHRDRG